MRRFFVIAVLSTVASTALAQVHLPTTATLGVSELPTSDATIFQFKSQDITIIRAADSAVDGILVSKSSDQYSGTTVTFKVPDGKMMVITEVEIPVFTPSIIAWFLQLTGPNASDPGWLMYDAFAVSDGTKNPNFKEKLASPLVFASGKTYQLHSSDADVNIGARGYYLDEKSTAAQNVAP